MDSNYIYNRNPILVLSYISKFRGHNIEITASKISKKLELSIGSVYGILKEFDDAGFIKGTKIGRATIYEPMRSNPIIKQFRIFDNLLFLTNLVEQLKDLTRKIILFGSCSSGEDTIDSDIDIFIIADCDMQTDVRRILSDFKSEREIKSVIMDSMELMEMERNDHVFYKEIHKGIVVWGEE
jgi:predicted nucleotidyltransferase